MRPIEFRAYDKEAKTMYYNVGLSPTGVQVYKDDNIPEEIVLDRGQDYFDIMQFTGLLDKNGKMVFEGDVVAIYYYGEKEAKPRIVQYIVGRVQYCLQGQNDLGSERGVALDTPGLKLEVIGNIYEHSHLLQNNET